MANIRSSSPSIGASDSHRRRVLRVAMSALAVTAPWLCSPSAWAAPAPVFEGRDGWLFPEWESTSVLEKNQIDANISLLQQAKDLFASQGIEMVFVVVPTKAVFYPDRLPSDHAVSPEIKGRYAYIVKSMAQAGMKTPDLLPVLRAIEQGRQSVFYRTDYHWTSMGAEAAATATAQAILQGPALPGKNGTGAKLGEWVNERHFGDLATRYLAADRRAAIGRDVFRVRLPPAGNASLFDDDPAPVHVMGNSFVQPYWGFSQKLSNLIDRPVSLSWNAGNVGQWVIALNYAESKDFAESRPKVIVWQMNEAQIQIGPNVTGLWDVQGLMPPQAWLARLKAAVDKK